MSSTNKILISILSILIGAALIYYFFYAEPPAKVYDNTVRKWPSKSYLVCKDKYGDIVYEGYSKSLVVYKGLTGRYTFTDPRNNTKVTMSADCVVDASRSIRSGYDKKY